MVTVCSRCALRESSQAKLYSGPFRFIPIDSATRHRAVVIMSAADFTCPPVRMQGLNEGPPWALESVNVSRLLDIEFVQAVDVVVKLQRDLRVEPWTLLRMLQYLSQRKVDNATRLVAEDANLGGAHARIQYLSKTFDVRVLTEVHDLLVQPMRGGAVHAVLKLLQHQFKKGVDSDAMIRRLCYADGPLPVRLTGEGTYLHWILMRAPAVARATGYVAYEEEKAASAGVGLSPLGFLTMRDGAGSTSSSQAAGSEASTPGSPDSTTSSKRHCPASAAGPASEDARAGECVAGSSDS